MSDEMNSALLSVLIGRIAVGVLVVAIIIISIRAYREERAKAVRGKMDKLDVEKEIQTTAKLIEGAENRCRNAGLVFLFLIGSGGLAFCSVTSSRGSGPDGMFDGLILIPFLVPGAIGALIVGLIWIVMWLQLQGLRATQAALSTAMKEPNQSPEPLPPTRHGPS